MVDDLDIRRQLSDAECVTAEMLKWWRAGENIPELSWSSRTGARQMWHQCTDKWFNGHHLLNKRARNVAKLYVYQNCPNCKLDAIINRFGQSGACDFGVDLFAPPARAAAARSGRESFTGALLRSGGDV
eukprot:2955710-Amphidinium_carterae.1